MLCYVDRARYLVSVMAQPEAQPFLSIERILSSCRGPMEASCYGTKEIEHQSDFSKDVSLKKDQNPFD